MNVATFFISLTLISIFSQLSFAAGSCQAIIKSDAQVLEDPVVVKRFERDLSYYNVEAMLKGLQQREDFDIKQAQVLFLGAFDNLNVHAVLLYKGHVIDPARTGSNRPVGKEINIQTLEQYMTSEAWFGGSEVRAVAAFDFLNEFPLIGPRGYLNGMKSAGFGKFRAKPIIEAGHPVQNLREWLIDRGIYMDPTR